MRARKSTPAADQMFLDRVTRGATMLDAAIPDWYKVVDAKSIDLNSSETCVLAQCWPLCRTKVANLPWHATYIRVGTPFGATCEYLHTIGYQVDLHRMGFGLSPYDEDRHRFLRRAWAREIECRRAKDKAVPIPVLDVVPEYVLTA